jgi:hypothetical protein
MGNRMEKQLEWKERGTGNGTEQRNEKETESCTGNPTQGEYQRRNANACHLFVRLHKKFMHPCIIACTNQRVDR